MIVELDLVIFYVILLVVSLNVGFGFRKYDLTSFFFKRVGDVDMRKAIQTKKVVTGAVVTLVPAYFFLWTREEWGASLTIAATQAGCK